MALYTRKQYLNKEVNHDEYYAQFVDSSVISCVRRVIGDAVIKKSKDQHFNDIPLQHWDMLAPAISSMCGRRIHEANDNGGISMSDCVCVAKRAAKIIRDGI